MEVMVDILLSLLSRPSRLIRQVCRTVFASICPSVTPAALAAILDVSEGPSSSRTFNPSQKHLFLLVLLLMFDPKLGRSSSER